MESIELWASLGISTSPEEGSSVSGIISLETVTAAGALMMDAMSKCPMTPGIALLNITA